MGTKFKIHLKILSAKPRFSAENKRKSLQAAQASVPVPPQYDSSTVQQMDRLERQSLREILNQEKGRTFTLQPSSKNSIKN